MRKEWMLCSGPSLCLGVVDQPSSRGESVLLFMEEIMAS